MLPVCLCFWDGLAAPAPGPVALAAMGEDTPACKHAHIASKQPHSPLESSWLRATTACVEVWWWWRSCLLTECSLVQPTPSPACLQQPCQSNYEQCEQQSQLGALEQFALPPERTAEVTARSSDHLSPCHPKSQMGPQRGTWQSGIPAPNKRAEEVRIWLGSMSGCGGVIACEAASLLFSQAGLERVLGGPGSGAAPLSAT